MRTHGYLAFTSADALDLERATYEPLHADLTAGDALRFVPERYYRRGKPLRLRFVGIPEALRERSPALAFTFALLLSESLRSYYPHLYPYLALAVAPSLRPAADDVYRERLGHLVAEIHSTPDAPEDGFDVYVIKDSHFDRAALRGLARYLIDGVLPNLAAYVAMAEEDGSCPRRWSLRDSARCSRVWGCGGAEAIAERREPLRRSGSRLPRVEHRDAEPINVRHVASDQRQRVPTRGRDEETVDRRHDSSAPRGLADRSSP